MNGIVYIHDLKNCTNKSIGTIHVSTTNNILIDNIPLSFGSRVVIDDILLWCDNVQVLLLYFESVCHVLYKIPIKFLP